MRVAIEQSGKIDKSLIQGVAICKSHTILLTLGTSSPDKNAANLTTRRQLFFVFFKSN